MLKRQAVAPTPSSKQAKAAGQDSTVEQPNQAKHGPSQWHEGKGTLRMLSCTPQAHKAKRAGAATCLANRVKIEEATGAYDATSSTPHVSCSLGNMRAAAIIADQIIEPHHHASRRRARPNEKKKEARPGAAQSPPQTTTAVS
mmetsp:Transcript_7959/g.23905  ORF Transcript_7959/g.23905 Transcript_7959/m.23905 type:complete len:143 (+) Transcript_7959:306-734(+)